MKNFLHIACGEKLVVSMYGKLAKGEFNKIFADEKEQMEYWLDEEIFQMGH
jgi:hypothetical protein